jgi:hypothetical protein
MVIYTYLPALCRKLRILREMPSAIASDIVFRCSFVCNVKPLLAATSNRVRNRFI